MAILPESVCNYFEPLSYGLEAVLPHGRIANKAFLLYLAEVLRDEPALTVPDLTHLKTLMMIADQVSLPSFTDVKTCCEAEAFLIRACPRYSKLEIRLMMRWLFLLLARHDRVEADLATVEKWFQVWRLVQKTHPIEQGLLVDYIRWLKSNQFAPQSILGSLREYRKLKAWMSTQGLDALGNLDNLALQRYLLNRACGYSNTSKQKILANLRPMFYYYQETMNGAYQIPDYSVKAPRTVGVNVSASHEEIERLWHTVQNPHYPAMARLMLVLIMGYGLPLRALPLLRFTDDEGKLVYTERLPCRRGLQEREVVLALEAPWLGRLWKACLTSHLTPDGYPYLFISSHGIRRKRPVSVDFCQRLVQEAVTSALGYTIPVNHLERGSIKALASALALNEFMAKTEHIPLTKTTRLMYWLNIKKDKPL